MDEQCERFRKAYWAMVHTADPLRLRAWESLGVTLPQLRILFFLRAQRGAPTGALATQFGWKPPTGSARGDRLVRRGLTARGARPDDRRIIPLQLTAEGEAVVGEIREGNDAHIVRVAEVLGD